MYDLIIIGSSPICILEAVNRSENGEKVLIIEKNNYIGGAWSCLNIFGGEDVENAIHYLLPNTEGINFLKKNLGIKIVKSNFKYRIFKISYLGYIHVHYDNIFSRILDKLISNSLDWSIIKDSFLNRKKSFYFKNGSPDFMKKVKSLLDSSNVKVRLNCKIEKFLFENKKVSLFANNKHVFKSKRVLLTNGSRLENVFKSNRKIKILEKFQPRPCVHLFVSDATPQKIKEAIFVNDSLIKYVHEVSSFAKGNFKNKKIFVFALKHEIKEKTYIYDELLNILKKAKICDSSAKLIETKWTDVILPTLFNEDLDRFEKEIGQQLITLKTESLSEAFGANSKRWNNIK